MELTLFVDHQCNLRCTYCYNGEKYTRPMTAETMRKAVALALSTRPTKLHLAFFGGEPLLHLDFVAETIEHVEQQLAELPEPLAEVLYLMNTNATLIDDRAIELMSPPAPWSVFISLDGPREIHDRFRVDPNGRGSFDDTLAGIERLRAADIPYSLLAVFGAQTGRTVGQALRSILPLEPRKVQLSANYREEWTETAIDELRQGLKDAGDAWMDLFRAGTALQVDPFQTKILAHLKGGLPCPGRCLLGASAITVAPSGRIYACGEMVGEDRDGALAFGDVDRGYDLGALRRMQAAKQKVDGICAPCELRDRCQSQCGCRHIALTGQLGEITETLCEIETAFIDESDRIAEILVAEQTPAFIEYFYGREWQPAQGAKMTPDRLAEPDD